MYPKIICVVLLCFVFDLAALSLQTSGQETSDSAVISPKGKAPHIATIINGMRRFADWLASGKTDHDTMKMADELLDWLDALIAIQRRAQDAPKEQSDEQSSSRGKEQNGTDNTQDESQEVAQTSRASEMTSQAGQGEAPESGGMFYGKGKGTVESKTFQSTGDWGGLPPKDREKAMRSISEKFPRHYRLLIEQYFRKMAEEY